MPAHNERAVITATLEALGAAVLPLRGGAGVAVIVSCNGCPDETAALARAAKPTARVLESDERGKAGAINRALALAADGPVIVLDADIRIDGPTLLALLAALHLYANVHSHLPTGLFANRNHQAVAVVCGLLLAAWLAGKRAGGGWPASVLADGGAGYGGCAADR